VKTYREMSDQEMLAWGAEESKARGVDLAVCSAEGLAQAQSNAKARRKAIGATRGQAADMVIRANREARRAS